MKQSFIPDHWDSDFYETATQTIVDTDAAAAKSSCPALTGRASSCPGCTVPTSRVASVPVSIISFSDHPASPLPVPVSYVPEATVTSTDRASSIPMSTISSSTILTSTIPAATVPAFTIPVVSFQ